jgi:hypothetical protein
MSKIEHWVEDRLFEMTGMSERDVVQFLIGMAKEAKNKEACYNKIQKTGKECKIPIFYNFFS